jgi:hypothetical protein
MRAADGCDHRPRKAAVAKPVTVNAAPPSAVARRRTCATQRSEVMSTRRHAFVPVFALRTRTRLLLFLTAADTVLEAIKGGLKMDVSEPRVRRRGFFLHSETTGEHDAGDYDNPEGVTVRVRVSRRATGRQASGSGGRARTSSRPVDESRPQIRSGSVTGSRQRAHLPR